MTAPRRDPICEDPRSMPDFQPIDEAARNGRFHLVMAGEDFAVAHWRDDRWTFSSGMPLSFEPEVYRP